MSIKCKGIKLLFSLAICISFFVYTFPQVVFAAESRVERIDRASQKLINSGLHEEEIINVFPEEDLIRISNAISVTSTTSYYMVTESVDSNECKVTPMSKEECLNAVKHKKSDTISSYASDTETTSDGYFTSTITLSTYTTGSYLVTYSFQWLTNPLYRGYDVAGAFTEGLSVNNVIFTYYKYDTILGTATTTHTITPVVKSTGRAVAMEFDLGNEPSLGYGISSNHRGYISFSANKANNTYVSAQAWGEYYHNKYALQISPSFSLTGVSVSFSSTSYMVELLPNPYCIFTF